MIDRCPTADDIRIVADVLEELSDTSLRALSDDTDIYVEYIHCDGDVIDLGVKYWVDLTTATAETALLRDELPPGVAVEESYLDMEEEEMAFAEATLLIHTGRRR